MAVSTLAIDIGGTGLKVIVLDQHDKAITERARIETPHPATPKALLKVIKELAAKEGKFDRVSVGFPGVGSSLFLDGMLVPNLELGHHPFRNGQTYEEQLCNGMLKKIGKKRWNK